MTSLPRKYGPSLLAVIVIVFALFCVWRSFMGVSYPIHGNVHDLWLPVNAAYAMQNGGIQHETFHSPFGLLYFVLTSTSYALIDAYPAAFDLPDIHYLSSLQFAVFLTVLFVIMRRVQDPGHRVPLWFFAILVIFLFQTRKIDQFGALIPDWYGIYNSQLWALFLLQAVNLMLWREREQTDRSTIILAALQTVSALVVLNYKVSFFIGSVAFAVLPLLFLGSLRRCLIYISTGVCMGLGGIALVAATGYSYPGYIADLSLAASAKTSMGTGIGEQLPIVLLYVVILQTLRAVPGPTADDMPDPVQRFAAHLRARFATPGARADMLFDLAMALSVAAASMGDYQTPISPYVLLIAFALFGPLCAGSFARPSTGSVVTLHSVLYAGILYWTAAFAVAGLGSLHLISLRSADAPGDFTRETATEVATVEHPGDAFSFTFRTATTLDKFLERGLMQRSDNWEQALFKTSYTLFSDGKFEQIGMPGAFSTHHYLHDLNTMRAWFEDRGLTDRGLRIGSNGFANPWPVLTQNRFPTQTQHWLHLGTTISPDSLDVYFETLLTADIVIVPLFGNAPIPDQSYLNCMFYLWNEGRGRPFEPQEVVGTYLVFVRDGGAVPLWSDAPVTIRPDDIAPRCANLRKHL